MVEIALAMAIIGIGISSVLVLFPVGINAGKSSVADNNIADVSEYMLGYLRAGMMSEWLSGSGTTFFSSKIPSSKPDDSSVNYNEIGDKNWIDSNVNGVFKFEQASGTGTDRIVDFSACVKVWQEADANVTFYALTDISSLKKDYPKGVSRAMYTKVKSSDYEAAKNPMSKYLKIFWVEISWPIEAPAEKRESRTYRMEIFNEAYVVDKV